MTICPCGAGFDPPANRPTWPKCIACTLTPRHARLDRFAQAPGDHPVWATEDVVTFTVPGPAIGKNRTYRAAYSKAGQFRGAVYKTTEAVRYQATIANHAMAALTQAPRWNRKRRFALELHFYFDNSRADVDGPIALVQDALQRVVYDNDSQLDSVHSEKTIVPRGQARLVATVRAL